ncbi:somatostatin receptor type 4-like [Haliotis rufescens]|uniref:somatostatin receptor type 4-like n=1 Tax=Haliotis rufescens TaxID=6454 RepID=UPI001EAFCB47|nr:somatostatin receptor type 4-like [Haliotis rufescens]
MGEIVLTDPSTNETAFTFLSEFSGKWKGQTEIEVTVLTIIFVAAVAGNGLVLLVILRCRRLRSATNFFIANLAVADLLLASGIPFIATTRVTTSWEFGDVICKLVTYVQFIAGTCSILTMMMISIERYTYICFSHRRRMSGQLACWIISGVWVISITFPVPIALAQAELSIIQDGRMYIFCGIHWPKGFHADVYLILIGILSFMLPLIVITIFYYKIFNMVRASSRRSQLRGSTRGNKLQVRLIKMSVLIVFMFVTMWLPFFVIGFFGVYTKSITSSNFVITIILAMGNSCQNPIIYGYFNTRFREEFSALCCCGDVDQHQAAPNVPSTEDAERS